MEKRRFILRFRGTGPIPGETLERINALPDFDVVDSTSRMLLVEATDEDAQALIETMPGWALSAEQTVPLPDSRPKVLEEAK
jgi:hypothetical protein